MLLHLYIQTDVEIYSMWFFMDVLQLNYIKDSHKAKKRSSVSKALF